MFRSLIPVFCAFISISTSLIPSFLEASILVSAYVEVSGFKRRKKRGVTARTDKGKNYNYPAERSSTLYLLQALFRES